MRNSPIAFEIPCLTLKRRPGMRSRTPPYAPLYSHSQFRKSLIRPPDEIELLDFYA